VLLTAQYELGNLELTLPITVFEKQLQLAVASKKPIVVHSREAEEDTIKIMKDNVPSDWLVHVHCFTSSVDMATKLLAHFSNLYIGS